jgi:hypothetical protein
MRKIIHGHAGCSDQRLVQADDRPAALGLVMELHQSAEVEAEYPPPVDGQAQDMACKGPHDALVRDSQNVLPLVLKALFFEESCDAF